MSRKTVFKISSVVVAAAAVLASCALAGCADKETPSPLEAGMPVRVLDGVEFDYDNMFFDDFTGGVDKDNWYIGKQAWGANGNGGVVPQNVNYTDDGILVLTGNGEYYTAGDVRGVGTRRDGTLAGAALISKFVTQAGRYEVKMKVLPRLGACNAFWTFAYDNDTRANHEIDIELPGGTHAGIISYERLLNTNYLTEGGNESQDTAISDVTDGNITSFADGEWHTFGFDWYTLEPSELGAGLDEARDGEENENSQADADGDVSLGKVVYFADGVVTAVSDAFIPYMQARLWLGVWFPNNPGFVGDARFESDNMYVDWIRYTPFKDQPYKEFVPPLAGDVASEQEYPSAPIAIGTVNKIANGDFEYCLKGKTNSGWEYYKRAMSTAEQAAIRAEIEEQNPEATESELDELYRARINEIRRADASEYCTVESGIGDKGSCGLKVEKIGLVSQIIDSIFDGFKIKLDFAAKGAGSVNVLYRGNGDTVVSEQRIAISSAEAFTAFAQTLVAPVGTKKIELEITSAFGTPLFIDDISATVVTE